MKMYKRIFGVLLCLCMLLGAVSLASATEDGATGSGAGTGENTGHSHENHPICGATHTDIGDHKGECPNLEWTKLYMDEDGKLYYGDDQLVDDTQGNYYTLGERNYYLDTNVSVTKEIRVTGNVTLCLNGHDLTQASTGSNLERLLEVGDGTNVAVLNICNCAPTEGSIALTTSDEYPTIDVNSGCTLNLFSGKINRENGTGTTVHLGTGAKTAKATLNMYGGEINQRAANYAVEARVAVGTYAINIYAGTITVNNFNGIQATNAHETEIRIAGGSIEAGGYAINIDAKVSLTLSGSPTLKGSDADIYLPANSHFTVTDDFTIGTDSVISVMQALGSNEKGVFTKPAASGSSLAEKAKYFVSAETGYCVTTSGNDLQLTPCEITTQPTADNSYTVTANGTTAPTYRWYTATRRAVPATDKNATDKGNYYWDGEWSIFKSAASISNEPIFSIDMKKGDTLTLSCENSFQGSITEVNLYNSSNEEVGEKETVMGTSGETIYKFTVPADGTYTLKLSARGFSMEETEWTSLSFTATVTGDVPNLEQALNGGTTLNTTNLCKGPYICRVTWQGKTDKGTTIIDSDPVTLDKNHTPAAATRENENPATCTADGSYDEVVKCSRCGAEISRTSKTIPALGHDFAAATCTAPKTCKRDSCTATEGTALGHDFAAATCTAPKTCKRDGCTTTEGTALGHDFAAATCTAPKTCKRDGCTATEGTALGHDFENGTYLYDATQHWKKCANCDATNTPVGHNVVTDKAKPATTTETGLTEGKHCDVCGKVLVAQEVTPKLTPRYYYNSTTTTTKDTTKKDNTKSPGTFDPGVGVYALTAVLSVTGMAWVGRKKH